MLAAVATLRAQSTTFDLVQQGLDWSQSFGFMAKISDWSSISKWRVGKKLGKRKKLQGDNFSLTAKQYPFRVVFTYHKMPEAASHDSAMQQHFLHQQQPNQQRLMLVVPTIRQATEKHEQHHQKVMDLKQAHCQSDQRQ